MPVLDKLILKELDHQKINVSSYSIILKKLDNVEKKTEFLNYMTKNRNTILSPYDIIERVKEISL